MSLDKSIQYGKEKRKPYFGSKSIDGSCRNHGGCDWCHENRIHKYRKKEESLNYKQKDWEKETSDMEWDAEYCYECSGYGNDEYYDEEKDEWVSLCDECFNNPNYDYWEDD